MSNYDEAKERENFATNLRYWMDIKGYSKIELAEKLDVTPSAVTHWCDGTKMPRMGKIQAIADLFKLQKSDLVNDASDAATVKRDELFDKKRVLFKLIDNVDEEDLNKIESIIDMVIGTKYDD